jgi:hypothetical protein
MKQELEQYRVEPSNFWQAMPMMGVGGYDIIGPAEKRKWNVIASWGRDGYDLGSWPLVIVFVHSTVESFDVIEYVEGDVCMYSCPTAEIRQSIIDEIAFFHRKQAEESWVAGYETVEQLPEELRGPYRRS